MKNFLISILALAALAASAIPAAAQVTYDKRADYAAGTNQLVPMSGVWLSDDGRACRGRNMLNHSGATLSSGTIVEMDDGYAMAITTMSVGVSSAPVGVVQDATCTDGAYCFIGWSGICAFRLAASNAAATRALTCGVPAGVGTPSVGRGYCGAVTATNYAETKLGTNTSVSAGNGDTILIKMP